MSSRQFSEHFIKNKDVSLHYIEHIHENMGKEELPPIVFVPGLTEGAEDYKELMEGITNRKSVALSLRGRGQSDSPVNGYTLEDHIQDIETVVGALKTEKVVLFAFSRGVAYTLGYAMQHPDRLAGLIIGDYPAIHTKLSEKWVDFMIQSPPWRGKGV
ncbi:alpha/beta fold hydrolase [Bacillus horti]|uniref:Pimeloyl-ACP methyl ester carboxylesterase n=1 Tax=Caldalkalibacillus horti TaxID=77523 RepID=A0ABT9VYG9_9BACI|nr:alpha/beta hydrolase [Bacillus horti]MDQ0165660.1 pimeloyl-ACP methyl ester carboxylesterase [Bacillus horti]